MKPISRLRGGRPVAPSAVVGSRPSRRSRGLAICGLVGAIGATGLTGVASAAVDPAHLVTVSKDNSIVLVEGLVVGEPVRVDVERNGVVIGTSTGQAEELIPDKFPGVGFFEVNHAAAPTVCWEGHTPEILPGDMVTVTAGEQGSEIVDTVPVADISVTEGPTALGGDAVTVKGRVNADPLPSVLDITVETRSLNPFRFRRVTPDEGTVRYDTSTPDPGDFVATFGNLSADEQKAVLNSFDVTAGYSPAANETTLATFGAVAGTEDPACPGVQRRAVTQITPSVLNIANEGAPVTVSGLASQTSNVDVTLDDEDPSTPAVTHQGITPSGQPTDGSQTWTTAFGNDELAGLDGTITASGAYTDAATGTVLNGATKTLLKDLVAPEAPSASPPGGTFGGPQSVTLNAVDETDTVRYRIGATGSVPDPTANSQVATGQIQVSSSQTIKAAAFDKAGNRSPVMSADYVIASVPGAPTIGTATAGSGSATVRWTAPTSNGGSAITGYTVHAFSISGEQTMQVDDATASSAEFTGLTNGTAYTFSVSAKNVAGSGPLSARSNAVTPVATVPGAPTIGTASPGNASATVRWTAPSNNGGSAITGYRVRVFQGTSTTVLRTVSVGNVTSTVVGSLTNGTPYRFDVAAVNARGVGQFSAKSNSVTPANVPTAPRIGTAQSGAAGGSVTATANWLAPTSTGGSPITGYQVRALRMSASGAVLSTTDSAMLSPTARSLQMTLPSGNYRFQVRAYNAIGQSPLSSRSNLVTAR